jgi:predicted DNA-binding protein with PD1-like motif
MKTLLLTGLFWFLCSLMTEAQLISSSSEMYAFRILPGEDLKEQIELRVKANGWKAAALVSAVGSLLEAQIRFANQPEAYFIPGKLEIVSLSGTLSNEGSHLHIAVADSTGRTFGGHLMPGCRVYTTAEIVIALLKDLEFRRETDPAYGYRELKIYPKKE